MSIKHKLCLLFTISILAGSHLHAQEKDRTIRVGLNYGLGTQNFFPYNDPDYTYKVRAYKGLINFTLKKSRRFSYELQLEPGIYLASHQLLNEYFIQPDYGADYIAQREIFKKEKTITEYVLNVEILVRYDLNDRFSVFILGSTGPMFSDTATERLARGFAFSDLFAFGATYKTGNIMFELRPGLRHVSNLDIQFPNSGHNSTSIDFGISVSI
jgi:Lipid A 3-O-deacylase (PagL)